MDGLSAEVKKDTKITGGGNLILGSESFKNATYVGIDSSVVYGDDGSATITNANTCRGFKFNAVSAHITKGVTLCLSVMYKLISGTDALRLGITFTSDDGQNYIAYIKTADQLEIEQTDGWVLRYGTWTPSKNGVLKTVEFDSNGNCTNKFSLLHPMLQYGNAPTAWNASSGDYLTQESAKSLFSQTADEIKTEVTKSVTESVTANVKDTATSTANDAVDSKLQDYATTATVESLKEDVSSISQKADSISTKVSSLKETITTVSNDLDSTKQEFKTVKESVSAIDQKADSITQTVTQRITGGNNIIAGTDDWNNATLDAGGNDLSKKGTYTISGESVRVTNRAQNTRFHFGADKTLVIAKGMTYCVSVLYKLNSGTDSLFLQFETKSSSGTKSYYGNAFKNAKQDITLDNGWKLRWAAFTATADGYADGLFVSTANDNATVTNDLTIMHPMVQMGNSPTAWTASTGDYLTTAETKTEIKQTVSEIKLTASTSGTSSTIKLTAGGTEITSAQINLSGVVTFSDLSTWNQDKTIINGGNITTGQIHNKARTTTYDLDNAWIRMGKDAGTRVDIDTGRIRWYWENNLTGVLSSRYGKSYIGDNSRYTFQVGVLAGQCGGLYFQAVHAGLDLQHLAGQVLVALAVHGAGTFPAGAAHALKAGFAGGDCGAHQVGVELSPACVLNVHDLPAGKAGAAGHRYFAGGVGHVFQHVVQVLGNAFQVGFGAGCQQQVALHCIGVGGSGAVGVDDPHVTVRLPDLHFLNGLYRVVLVTQAVRIKSNAAVGSIRGDFSSAALVCVGQELQLAVCIHVGVAACRFRRPRNDLAAG